MPSAGIEPAKVPQSLKQPCQGVSTLPDGSLTPEQTARFWGADRANLGACKRKHSGLVKSVEAIEGQGK